MQTCIQSQTLNITLPGDIFDQSKPLAVRPPTTAHMPEPSLLSALCLESVGCLTGTGIFSTPNAWHSALHRGLGQAFMAFPEASGLYSEPAAVTPLPKQ